MRELLKPAHPFIALVVAAVAAVAAIAQCGLLLDSASARQSVRAAPAPDVAVKVVAETHVGSDKSGRAQASAGRSN